MQERAATTRRAVLEAAAHLFDEKGYAGTSISDISALSGRTSGAIYFHYTSKENLARAVIEEHFATWPGLIGGVAAQPPLEQLVLLSFTVARAFRDDVVVRAGARLWSERKAIDAVLPVPFVGWIDTVAGLLQQGRADGDLAVGVEPRQVAHVVVCAFFGLHTVSDALDGRRQIEAHLTSLWLLLLPSLQAHPDPVALLTRVRARLADPTGTEPWPAPSQAAVPG
ncbi:ScbR family autoregulator-binding transcription factor [Streptacidiphilus sp. P02-A3a]|uniref:ScbR family autoregulator-binding transcription factor n=1 Tax=Streptacidiphilus sp. P02-A3a TaxID=2704468 RepID=UPI0015FE04A3|nr:ScbR family autoregulator-binding transcription factor [Streptacidiphilus sp. P02-A3a]QMU70066.1 TetR/AcrR family transcriptional regulator [Streptacidiphilus sp. P02-A3a]